MNKPRVNESQYAKLVHEKMQDHKMYEEGMGVKLNPDSSERPLGLTVIGGAEARGILAWAKKKVQEEYELVISQ